MAIDTLAKLKSRLAYLANRDDMFDTVTFSPGSIDGEITIAIENATKSISRDLAKRGGNGLQELVTDSLATVGGTETITLPSGYAGARTFILTTNPRVVLQALDYAALVNNYPSTTTGQPQAYAVVMGATPKLYLGPIPDGVYTTRLIYFKNLDALTDSTTNPVFDAHPDIYEAAGMVEISLAIGDEAAAASWRVVYETKMNDLSSQDRNAQWAAAMSGAMPQVQVVVA